MSARDVLWQPWDGRGLEHLRLMLIVADSGRAQRAGAALPAALHDPLR